MCNECPRWMKNVEQGAIELSQDCNRLNNLPFFLKSPPTSTQKDGSASTTEGGQYRLHLDRLDVRVPLRALYDAALTCIGRGTTYALSIWRR